VQRWARAYLAHGRVTITATRDDSRAAVVADWSRARGDAVMIAARRADVIDLNQRARSLLQQQHRLPLEQLTIGRRSFAVGDQVITTRNDRATGTLNGQRGTIAAIDTTRGSVTVTFDRGTSVTIDRPQLAAGRLEHAYALTAHRAQGATVDETFILGGE
jgi:ATP-dependent exoDNAse (exonuclease V) alpha subunit